MITALRFFIAINSALIILGAGCITTPPSQEPAAKKAPALASDTTAIPVNQQTDKPDSKIMEKPSSALIEQKEDSNMMKNGREATKTEVPQPAMIKYSSIVLAGKQTLLLNFNSVDYERARAENKLIVLYFYANWCPTCKAEFPEIQSAFNELNTDRVVGFRVNYNDSETDDQEKNLAREFGVAYQHTKVLLKNGQRILKAPDSWSKQRYVEEINKVVP